LRRGREVGRSDRHLKLGDIDGTVELAKRPYATTASQGIALMPRRFPGLGLTPFACQPTSRTRRIESTVEYIAARERRHGVGSVECEAVDRFHDVAGLDVQRCVGAAAGQGRAVRVRRNDQLRPPVS
jgi:hypothetical protein